METIRAGKTKAIEAGYDKEFYLSQLDYVFHR